MLRRFLIAASALAAVAGGAGVVRVHDVGPAVDALKVWNAQRRQGPTAARGEAR